jgi:UDP-N-acetyl-D-galactosamine dehydrogenase
MKILDCKIAVIGLGYVGLPLAVEFGKKYNVLGFDINKERIQELINGHDKTLETNKDEISSAIHLKFSSEKDELKNYNVFIVTVPTPINQFKTPDLGPLLKATSMIGAFLKKGDIVIYESTVYPGCTEEDCVPILEAESNLIFNKDFFCGYSPERINPGDKINTLIKIKKVTSGSTPEIANLVDDLYRSIIIAGTYKAPSIKVAEASKAIENAQRDINISFVNELALIFDKIGIDTNDVLDAASTKWNFLKYKPGLVGGHCIGVDPYYLAQRAQEFGYHPEIILAGRRLNDSMGEYVASQVVKLMIKKGISINGAKLLMLGITFKENCPDVRNTKIVDVIAALKEYGIEITLYDPWANPEDVMHEYNLTTVKTLSSDKFDAIVLGVAHKEFLEIDLEFYKKANAIIYDVKGILKSSDGKL